MLHSSPISEHSTPQRDKSTVARKLTINLVLLLVVILIGTYGYMVLEGADFSLAFYMTIITLSTVGYGELIPLHGPSRVLTVFVIISGLTIGAISLGTITSYLVSGEILEKMRWRKMRKRLERLKGHIIVAGFGKLGREVARELEGFGHGFCIVESDPEHIEQAQSKDYIVIEGDASDDTVLLDAGIERAYGLVASLTGEAGNVMVTIAARNLNPDLVIVARGVDESSESKLIRAGADRVELPFRMGGRRMAAQVLKPSLVEFFDLFMDRLGYKLSLQEVSLTDQCPVLGKSIAQLDIRRATSGAVIMAIKRQNGEVLMHPDGNQVFQLGDQVLIMGDDEQMNALQNLL